jgi:8-oxo-dGTP diphosphatase
MPNIYKVALLLVRDRKVLFVRSKGKIPFYNLGGKQEQGELPKEALVREVWEEVSLTIDPASIEHLKTFSAQADGKEEGTLVVIDCYTADCPGEPVPNFEIEEVAWFTSADKDRTTATGKMILNWLALIGWIA